MENINLDIPSVCIILKPLAKELIKHIGLKNISLKANGEGAKRND